MNSMSSDGSFGGGYAVESRRAAAWPQRYETMTSPSSSIDGLMLGKSNSTMIGGGGGGGGYRYHHDGQRYETMTSPSSSVDGLMIGGGGGYRYHHDQQAAEQFELGQQRRRHGAQRARQRSRQQPYEFTSPSIQRAFQQQQPHQRAELERAVDVSIVGRRQQAELAEQRQRHKAEEAQMFARHLAEITSPSVQRAFQQQQPRQRAELERAVDVSIVGRRQQAELAEQRQRHKSEEAQMFARHLTEITSPSVQRAFQQQQPRQRTELERAIYQRSRAVVQSLEAERAEQHQAEEAQMFARHMAELRQQRARNREMSFGSYIQTRQRRLADLSEEVISKYLKIRVPSRDQDKGKICSVCLDGLYDEDENINGIATLDCRHEYHYCCIKQWLQRKNICPLCNRIAIHVT